MTCRILSYNIFLRPPFIKNNASDHKDARLEQFCAEVLPNYDIVALQEMFRFGSSRLSRLLSMAKRAGFLYSLTSPPKGLCDLCIDGGLVILSRLPFEHAEYITFQSGVHSDK
jgi:hypothetical protein